MTKEYAFIIKKLQIVVIIILSIFLLGTFGFHFLEDMALLDSFYMTVITISTVGYREIKELSSYGKIFNSFLILFGVSTVAYGYSVITSIIVEGELKQVWIFRRKKKMLEKLKDHYIVCGYGRMGSYICKKLKEEKIPFVVIDKNPALETHLENEDYLYILDDSSREEVLTFAGVERAKGLISVVSSDADNVYIVLTARQLNPKLYIIARAAEESSEQKMYKAGADKVISPYIIGGERMALAVLKPSVLDFIEIAVGGKAHKGVLKMEEILISQNSKLVGKTLMESQIREITGSIIIAIKKSDGTMEFNPKPKYKIDAGDVFIALGSEEHLTTLEDMAYGKS
ncbi:MAG: NAD-binding protein [Proteobacteria bacterium]|nr:NAD-binding protein [Pseudomonadota bacterium]